MQPLFNLESLAPACLATGFLLFVTTVSPPSARRMRLVVLACLVGLALRYLWWRVSATLPPWEFRLGALYAWGFFALECASYVSAFLTYGLALRLSDRTAEAAALAEEAARAPKPLSVDVFIPTLSEDKEVLERTIVCAAALDYPAKTVYVLDDGRRDWLKAFCAEKGVQYIARTDNAHAKAGNLNHGLAVSKERSNGALILVLDADFAPRRDFLKRTVGFFADPKLGVLQTPQAFFNPDPIQFNYAAVGALPDEQRLLFGTLLPAKDGWGVATCCGTSSLTRRSALDAIGGMPTDCVTEDMLLSYRLYEKGFSTRYLNERLSVGMAPEGFREYLTQRFRWCLGTIQQAFLHTGPLGRNGLAFRHRVEFTATLLYWCASLPFLLAGVLAPVFFGFTGLTVIQSGLGAYLDHFLPLFLAQFVALPWFLGVRTIPLIHDAPNLILSLTITPLVGRAFVRPFGRRFEVTAKGGDRSATRIHWPILWRVGLLFLLLATALALTLDPDARARYGGDSSRGLMIHLLWGLHGLGILALAALLAIELPRRRRDERFLINEEAVAEMNGRERYCVIEDLSLSGARLRLIGDGVVPDQFTLRIPDAGSVKAEVVRETGGSIGVRFVELGNQRDALIRKVFGGNHSTAAMLPKGVCSVRTVVWRVLKRIAGRV